MASKSLKKSGVSDVKKKTVNLEDLTVNPVLSLFKHCFSVQIFYSIFCFFVERNSMDSSYMLWNKFQDYRVSFILTDHFLARRFGGLTRHLQDSLNLVY